MHNPFNKPAKTEQEYIPKKVRFVRNGKVLEGMVFGLPFMPNLLSQTYYHVEVKNGVVYDIPVHAVEEIK